jgi:hypothetical protein
MTIQLHTIRHGKSKAALQAELNAMPDRVRFWNPSPFSDNRSGFFSGSEMKPGESFACVLDPDTRRRFAIVARTASGFRVT